MSLPFQARIIVSTLATVLPIACGGDAATRPVPSQQVQTSSVDEINAELDSTMDSQTEPDSYRAVVCKDLDIEHCALEPSCYLLEGRR
jgi:hypothetical protein